MPFALRRIALASMLALATHAGAQAVVTFAPSDGYFLLANAKQAAPIVVEREAPETLRVVTHAFTGDVAAVTGVAPTVLADPDGHAQIILVAVVGNSPLLASLQATHKLNTQPIQGKWESDIVAVVEHPFPGVDRALIIAGSDRRGAAYALFGLSRSMGVSPWNWWADVPIRKHDAVYVKSGISQQASPSVPYRGIFFNDEDWGLRPWAAAGLDRDLKNIGPRTYERVFELLLRLRANSLWPAMHPGTLAFNAVAEDAVLADRWGIVMGSSHSEALLRNNVGEWDKKRDGDWNYQTNKSAINAYWNKRVEENGKYENFYTVGMRGLHDSGLEATGSDEVKARLVESAMSSQRQILAKHANSDVTKVPQVIWLYKESLDLYRAGMTVPDDVTLGWTDDNFGYIRQLPNPQEQQRTGGSGIYYHVSYWGRPHDYLWLCTTPPAQIREEMTKAYEQNARRFWMLNVGDLKPAELDIDYFLQLAWDEPAMASVEQKDFLLHWFTEQMPASIAPRIAALMTDYYHLNFIRKPEFMGFNGYDDAIKRTSFNPLGPVNQNAEREAHWVALASEAKQIAALIPAAYQDAFFELVAYPVEAAAGQNLKFLATDRTFLDLAQQKPTETDATQARAVYGWVQSLTAQYNTLAGGKWKGMMDAAPRTRHVFELPQPATAADAGKPLPSDWAAGTPAPLTQNAAKFTRKDGSWKRLADLSITGDSMQSTGPGWLEYTFTTTADSPATVLIDMLPTFALYPGTGLRFTVSSDGNTLATWDAEQQPAAALAKNVLRNYARFTVPASQLSPGKHVLRLTALTPGIVFEHVSVTQPGTAPGYPVPQ